MPIYTPPLRDMQFVMHEVLKVTDEYKAMPRHADVDADTINAILEEGGKFASEVTFPLNISGDEEGCKLDRETHEVTTPKGFKEAYAQYVEGGWPALSCDPAYGGQGLPIMVNQCFYEMLNSANQAWTMYPGLTHGAYEALHAHGTPEQKQMYLPKLTSGEWTGTMCLTEPHCGTDLGMLRTKAEPQADGTYKITGNKIFISAGEHDIVEQHRAPGAGPPAGCAAGQQGHQPVRGAQVQCQHGRLPGYAQRHLLRRPRAQDGHPRQRHGADRAGRRRRHPGRPAQQGPARHVRDDERRAHRRRHAVAGLDRSGVSERAGLRQGPDPDARSLTGPKNKDKPADPIIVHPDVRKMLLTAKAYAEGGRALSLYCAFLIDRELHHPDEKVRKDSAELVALLTPIVKAFLTDNGHIATNACMQVFGGHGFIKEWGMEQFVRDNRINMIYEGTNTVQSLDLLGRKVLGNNGATLKKFGKIVAQLVQEEGANEKMAEFIKPIAYLGEQMTKFTTEIGLKAFQDPDEVGAAAVDYLRVAGHLVFGYFWARMAQVALREIAAGNTDPFYQAKLQTARFYFAKLFPETEMLMRAARGGSKVLMDTDLALT